MIAAILAAVVRYLRHHAELQRSRGRALQTLSEQSSPEMAAPLRELALTHTLDVMPLGDMASALGGLVPATHNYVPLLTRYTGPATVAANAPDSGTRWEQCAHCSTIRAGDKYWEPAAAEPAWSNTEPACTRRDL